MLFHEGTIVLTLVLFFANNSLSFITDSVGIEIPLANVTESPDIGIIDHETKLCLGKILDAGPKPTLEALCKVCNIPKVNCSCEQKLLLCAIVQKEKNSENDKAFIINGRNSSWFYTLQATFEVAFGTVSIIGNGLVVATSSAFFKKLSRCHRLIALLAVLDLSFAAISIITAAPKFWTYEWIYGSILCILLPDVNDIVVSMALAVIVIITFERYMGIIYPYNFLLTDKKLLGLVIVNALLAAVLEIPDFLHRRLDDTNICKVVSSIAKIHNWILFLFCFIIPAILASLFYIRIIKRLILSAKECFDIIGSDQQKKKRLQESKRITKILVSVLIAFVVLTLPIRIYWLIKMYRTDWSIRTFQIIKLVCYLPYSLHVAINPIIYSLIDNRFRRNVRRLCRTSKSKTNMVSSNHCSYMTNVESEI